MDLNDIKINHNISLQGSGRRGKSVTSTELDYIKQAIYAVLVVAGEEDLNEVDVSEEVVVATQKEYENLDDRGAPNLIRGVYGRIEKAAIEDPSTIDDFPFINKDGERARRYHTALLSRFRTEAINICGEERALRMFPKTDSKKKAS